MEAQLNLVLEPAHAVWLEALLEGDEVFTARFCRAVAAGWCDFPEALPHALAAARAQDADPWGSHLFFASDGTLIGWGGFKGAPRDDTVEIGYAVAPSWRRRGVATAATQRMIERARSAGVRFVIAHTLPALNASTRVLTHCGFAFVGPASEPEGTGWQTVWRWELAIGDEPGVTR